MISFRYVCLALALISLCTQPAFAYIDVGSGSFFVQFLLALLLGSLAYVKLAWKRLIMMFRKSPKTEQPPNP